MLEDGLEERSFALEMVIERALARAGFGEQGVGRRGLVAVLGKSLQAHTDEAFAHGSAAVRLSRHDATLQTVSLFAKQTIGL